MFSVAELAAAVVVAGDGGLYSGSIFTGFVGEVAMKEQLMEVSGADGGSLTGTFSNMSSNYRGE